MDVALVNPPTLDMSVYIREGRCQGPLTTDTTPWPQISLAYIASVLEKQNFKVGLWDCMISRTSIYDLLRNLSEADPFLVILNVTTPTIDNDMKVCARIKKELPNAVTAAFGAHVSATAPSLLKQHICLDVAIKGEPEHTVLEIAQRLSAGIGFAGAEGSIARVQDKIVAGRERPPIQNLDQLGFPARHLIPNEKFLNPFTAKPFTLVQTSRGCPYSCTFCVAPLYEGKRVRTRSANHVADELQYDIMKGCHIRDIYFFADTFTFNRRFVVNLCEQILKRKLDIVWRTNSRVDKVDRQLLKLMKKAGCEGLGFGVESGVQEILDNMRKGITLSQSVKAFKLCTEVGIPSFAFFIFGYPGETAETLHQTLRFAKRLNPDFVQFIPAMPFPGTELREIAQAEGLIVSDKWSLYDAVAPVVRTKDMSAKELGEFIRKAYLSFYFRPSYIAERIVQTRNIRQLMRMAKAAIPFVKRLIV